MASSELLRLNTYFRLGTAEEQLDKFELARLDPQNCIEYFGLTDLLEMVAFADCITNTKTLEDYYACIMGKVEGVTY